MSTAGVLKMTTISMEEKPIAMAPLNSCSTMNPSMDKSNPRSGVTITARPVRTSTNQRNDTVLLHQKMIRMDHEVTTHSNVTTRSQRK